MSKRSEGSARVPEPGQSHSATNLIPFQKPVGAVANSAVAEAAQTHQSPYVRVDDGVSSMAAPTREEIDAKLAAIEARTETRFVELSGKIDRLSDSIGMLTGVVTDVKSELASVGSQVKEENRFTRWTIGITLIASLIAFAAALWTTQGNLLSAFQAGLASQSQSDGKK